MKESLRICSIAGLIALLVIVACCGCTLNSKTVENNLDYSKSDNWVSLPDLEKDVDVFYIYPTIYSGTDILNMDITDPDLRQNAKGLLTAQAGVYSPYANVFAPFYRQQSGATQSMEPYNGGRNAFADSLFQFGYNDALQAFDYYIENLNPGRPFILAGHSQGSMVVIQLLRDRFANPELQQLLIAAYPIGYTVTKKDLETYKHMKLAKGETDVGVIITYNTQGPNALGSPVLLKDAVCINPLNWKTDGTPALNDKNIEAIFFEDGTGKVLERSTHFAGAYIDTITGALIATNFKSLDTSHVNLNNLGRWPGQVYHKYDYAFWYSNLKENVEKRILAYKDQQRK